MTPDNEYERAPKLPFEMKPETTSHTVEFPLANRNNHRWRQHGYRVHCDSCDPQHGFEIKHDQQLTGIDANGYPIIKSISALR